MPRRRKAFRTYPYDPEKAKDLLLSAGFQYNPNGELEDADGNRVRFTLITNSRQTKFASPLALKLSKT